MAEVDTGRYTIGVFKDVASADRGIEALKRQGFPAEALTVLAKESPDTSGLLQKVFGRTPDKLDLPGIGDDRRRRQPARACLKPGRCDRRAGSRSEPDPRRIPVHDGRIFETLTGRGGVLVAVRSEPRAADALSTLHCYGGGNAAIGAWTGRL